MMRAAYLFAASVIVCVALFVHAWAGVDHGDLHGELGLRSAVHCDAGECWTHDLDELYGVDDTGRLEGTLATYALGAAAIAMLIAAGMVRKGPIEPSVRIAFAVPCALAILAAIAYAHRVASARGAHIGWAPIVAVAALLVGVLAIAMQPRSP